MRVVKQTESQPAQQFLEQIKIVLCQTSHPGNIGAAARAMKTMGLQHLVLVNPKEYPSEEALARSSGAMDVLENAEVVSSLEQAVADCRMVIGTSSRNRALPWPLVEPREIKTILDEEPTAIPMAIVFGRESTGLLNEELQLCHYHVNIPANPDYMSLNLAAAVQVICYECRLLALKQQSSLHSAEGLDEVVAEVSGERKATVKQTEGLYQHFEGVMTETGFFDPNEPKLLPARLHRLFAKAQLTEAEVNIMRGFLASMTKHIKYQSKTKNDKSEEE
ncbi:RNA methyltransferase [Kangiella sp. HD9-110m-PIT-SAG06]|nr:RNA methyltransferase [Kangiella sp. HD9-110m-PIT-SAG06]RDX37963.1 RNA methyltransferase [Kangiella sp. HD9-110m-PIT-SAG07]